VHAEHLHVDTLTNFIVKCSVPPRVPGMDIDELPLPGDEPGVAEHVFMDGAGEITEVRCCLSEELVEI
jgi:hypothetical protein